MSHILVIGHGPAAHRLLQHLHDYGHPGPVTVLAAELRPAHHRPLLTSVLAGRLGPDALRLPPPPGTQVEQGTVATAIDRARRVVHARRDGTSTTYSYDVLVLASGARPVVPALPGATGQDGRLVPGVTTLRTTADCDRIAGATAAVLGGGPLGVETASALALRGTATTLVCAGPHPLHERLGDTCAGLLTERLERAGVTVLSGRTAVRRLSDRLLLDDGTAVRADTLVLCTGAEPDIQLARDAGLQVRTGIVVDDALRTGDTRIHAIGDCAEHADRATAGYESALAQADMLAAILTGREMTHRAAPAVLRLRTHVADVCCIGSPAAFKEPGIRTVGLVDRDSGRYARIALRDDRIVAAVLLGLPEAVAAVGHLHRRGQPVPSDRLSSLLGIQSEPPAAGPEAHLDAVVCLCNNVPWRQLAEAWRIGARTVTALAKATRATTGCGGCSRQVEGLCADWSDAAERELEPMA
ncbi:FAD-dependent oxidoreductase [Streptomyces sp. NPDC006365]|uniref:FAD-dependent oxidoreductase n=1 Tax=Streptomyces sp. NPDC006365 TaxID=3364744 RepID=UPI00369FAAA2